MVTIAFQQKLLRTLEMYLLKEKNFSLDGSGYSLILFIPTNYYAFDGRNSLVLSADALNNKRERTVLDDIFTRFKSALSFEEYSLISSVSILHTDSALVKKLNVAFPFQQGADAEYILNSNTGDDDLQNARLVRSSVLTNLVQGEPCNIALNDGRSINGNVVGIDQNYVVSLNVADGHSGPELVPCFFGDIVAVHRRFRHSEFQNG